MRSCDLIISTNIARILRRFISLQPQEGVLQLVAWKFCNSSNIRWDMSFQRWGWWQVAWWTQRSDLNISVNISRIFTQINAFEPNNRVLQLVSWKFLNISNICGDMGSERLGSGTPRASAGLKPTHCFSFVLYFWSATYRSICYRYQ